MRGTLIVKGLIGCHFTFCYSIFARILLFFFLYLKMRLQAEYLRILLLIRSSNIETNPGPKKTVLPEVFSLEYKWTGSSSPYQTTINGVIHSN